MEEGGERGNKEGVKQLVRRLRFDGGVRGWSEQGGVYSSISLSSFKGELEVL